MKAATLETHATPEGIQLVAKNFASGVSLDFFRSETLGVDGAKLNDKPVSDTTFLDKTAVPGVQYFYTARLAAGSATPTSARFKSVTTAQTKSRVMRVHATRTAPKAAPARRVAKAKAGKIVAFKAAPVPVPESFIRGLAATTIAPSGPVTINTNTTWTLAGSPYYVKNDVTLASGKTLTIQPGVKVYFANAVSGVGAPGTSGNPSAGVDLIVHGRLLANGTLTKKIIFTSIASAAEQAGGAYTPTTGEWGYLYFDKRWASQIQYADISFGSGIWSDHTGRPYVLNSRITNTSDDAIYMKNPYVDATTPRPKFVGNTILMTDSNEGIYIYAQNAANEGIVLDPYIAYNTIQGNYCVDVEIYDAGVTKYGNNIIKGTLYKNKLTSLDYEAVYLESYTRKYKTAQVLTKFVGNTIDSQQSDDDGVYADAYNYDYGPSVCSPTFYGDKIRAYSYPAYIEAYSDESSDRTEGNVTVNPTFTNCQFAGAWEDAIYLWGESDNKGKVTVNPRIVNSKIESAEYDCLYAEANSERGQAFCQPFVSGSTMVSNYGGSAIYVESYGRGWTVASPKIYRSTLSALDDYVVYAYADSEWSLADVNPYVYDCTLRGYNECLYLEAYGSDAGGLYSGPANCKPVVIDSTCYSFYDDCIYAYANTEGYGAATANPVITNTYVTADDGYAVDAEANTVNGAAYCSPVVTDSHLASMYECIYAYTKRDSGGSAVIDRSAYSSPKVRRSTLNSTDYPPLEIYAYNNNKGKAHIKPVLDHSMAINQYDDDGLYLYADKNQGLAGDTIVEPIITSSDIKAEDDGVYIFARGSGPSSNARVLGSLVNSRIRSPQEYGFDVDCRNNDGTNGGGVAEFKTKFTNVSIDAQDDYAIYAEAQGGGMWPKLTQASPVITGGKFRSGDGIELYAQINNGLMSGKTLVAPRVVNCPVSAQWDYPLYCYSSTNGRGTASANAYVYNSPFYAYYSTYLYSHSVGGDAYNASEVRGISAAKKMRIESFDDYGVEVRCFTDGTDKIAKSTGKFRFLSISPYNSAVYSNLDATNGTAYDYTYVGYNSADAKWGLLDYGIELNTDGKKVTAHPTVRNNWISTPDYDGIYVDNTASSGTCVSTPVIVNNTILRSGESGIDLSATTSDSNNPLVQGNRVTDAYNCGIEMWGYRDGRVEKNVINGTGVGNTSSSASSIAGIFWSDSKTAEIWKNTIMHSRVAVGVDDLAGNVSLHWNNFGGYYGKTDGSWDRPYNVYVETATSGGFKVDARYNWWSTTSAAQIADTIDVQGGTPSSYVNYTSPSAAYMPL